MESLVHLNGRRGRKVIVQHDANEKKFEFVSHSLVTLKQETYDKRKLKKPWRKSRKSFSCLNGPEWNKSQTILFVLKNIQFRVC